VRNSQCNLGSSHVGGGFFVSSSSTLFLEAGSSVRKNVAVFGGGIHLSSSSSSLYTAGAGITIRQNQATFGAAIEGKGHVYLRDASVTGNIARASTLLQKMQDIGFGAVYRFSGKDVPLKVSVYNKGLDPCSVIEIDSTVTLKGNTASTGGAGVFFKDMPLTTCNDYQSTYLVRLLQTSGSASNENNAPYGGMVSSFIGRVHASANTALVDGQDDEVEVRTAHLGVPLELNVTAYDYFGSRLESNYHISECSISIAGGGIIGQGQGRESLSVNIVNGLGILDLVLLSYESEHKEETYVEVTATLLTDVDSTGDSAVSINSTIRLLILPCDRFDPDFLLQKEAAIISSNPRYVCRKKPFTVYFPLAVQVVVSLPIFIVLLLTVILITLLSVKRKTKELVMLGVEIWQMKLCGLLVICVLSLLVLFVTPEYRGLYLPWIMLQVGASMILVATFLNMQRIRSIFNNQSFSAKVMTPRLMMTYFLLLVTAPLVLTLPLISAAQYSLVNPISDLVSLYDRAIWLPANAEVATAASWVLLTLFLLQLLAGQYLYFTMTKRMKIPPAFFNKRQAKTLLYLGFIYIICGIVSYQFVPLINPQQNYVTLSLILTFIPAGVYLILSDLYLFFLTTSTKDRQVGYLENFFCGAIDNDGEDDDNVGEEGGKGTTNKAAASTAETKKKGGGTTKGGGGTTKQTEVLHPSVIAVEKTISSSIPVKSIQWVFHALLAHKEKFEALSKEAVIQLAKTIPVVVDYQALEDKIDMHSIRGIALCTELEMLLGLGDIKRLTAGWERFSNDYAVLKAKSEKKQSFIKKGPADAAAPGDDKDDPGEATSTTNGGGKMSSVDEASRNDYESETTSPVSGAEPKQTTLEKSPSSKNLTSKPDAVKKAPQPKKVENLMTTMKDFAGVEERREASGLAHVLMIRVDKVPPPTADTTGGRIASRMSSGPRSGSGTGGQTLQVGGSPPAWAAVPGVAVVQGGGQQGKQSSPGKVELTRSSSKLS
jgi:hypothetical protein